MTQYHIIVSGRVQGVGFRHFTLQKAKRYHLTGWVRNLFTGEVEILVAGEKNNVKKFVAEIEQGPERAKVENLTIELVDCSISVKEFTMREDGVEPCKF